MSLFTKKTKMRVFATILALFISLSFFSLVKAGNADNTTTTTTTSSSSSEETTTTSSASTTSKSSEAQTTSSEATQPQTSEIVVPSGQAFIVVGEQKTQTIKAGNSMSLRLPLVNWGNVAATNVTASLMLSSETAEFPFEIEKSVYAASLRAPLKANRTPAERKQNTQILDFGKLKLRKDVKTGYARIRFTIRYYAGSSEIQRIERYLYVKTIGDKAKPSDIDKVKVPSDYNSGGYVDTGGGMGGSSSDSNRSVPRLMIGGFTTKPKLVKAGENFDLHLKLKNNSSKSLVKNIKVQINSAEAQITPLSGASSVFVKQIAVNAEHVLVIPLKAASSINKKANPLSVKLEFEDKDGGSFNTEENIIIEVQQNVRCEIGKATVNPGSVAVNDESNLMFSIYNKGKATLFNLSVKFDSKFVQAGEVYVGNLEAGQSNNVDTMLKALKVTGPKDKIQMNIRYEDEQGKETVIKKEISLEIKASTEKKDSEDDMLGNLGKDDFAGMEEVAKAQIPPWLYLLGGFILLAIVATIVSAILRRRKKARELAELEDDYEVE